MKVIGILGLLFFLSFGKTIGQSRSTEIYSAVVIDQKDTSKLQNVHIISYQSLRATVSDQNGHFSIPVHIGDTLSFSSVGYKKKFVVFQERSLDTIKLIKDTVWIKTVEIKGYPNWNQFKMEFVKIDIDKTKYRKIIIPGVAQYEGPYIEHKPTALHNPASYLYERYNKQAVLNRKLEKRRMLAEKKWLDSQLK